MSGSNVFFDTQEQTSIFTSSDTFIVPNRVTMLRILGIGAGAGGRANSDLTIGAAAGDIENIFIPVTSGETITITIGSGGVGVGVGASNSGGNTTIATSAKTYYFLGGIAQGYDATGNSAGQQRYAINGVNDVTTPGGEAGYEDGGDAKGVFTDGEVGGIGAGGGNTSDGGQVGGSGGAGRVQLWYRD